jgi:hypothetical protein
VTNTSSRHTRIHTDAERRALSVQTWAHEFPERPAVEKVGLRPQKLPHLADIDSLAVARLFVANRLFDLAKHVELIFFVLQLFARIAIHYLEEDP